MHIEKSLIEHCSPTLAGLKTASLFRAEYDDEAKLYEEVQLIGEKLASKGIVLIILKKMQNTALIYVCRESMLRRDIMCAHSRRILKRYGYEGLNTTQAIQRLSDRLCRYDEFPHEIGLFLGYPPEDVEGFICNKGQNCNLCGYWKVYGEASEALAKFAAYDKCKMLYKKLWAEGRDILRLTVKKQPIAA